MGQVFGTLLQKWVCMLAVFSALACGGGGGGVSGDSTTEGGTGRVAFGVQWERAERSTAPGARAGVDDCLDVATVRASVFSGGGLLQEAGPWDCTDRQGTIAGIPAGNTVWVGITGFGANGRALYYGESAAFFLAAGETHDAGTIPAGSFIPFLTSPGEGAVVAPAALVLRWQAVEGADRYRVALYSDSDFVNEVHSAFVAATEAPSYQPGAEVLSFGMPHSWRVQAADGAGHLGEFSEGRSFTPTDQNLIVEIFHPADSDLLYAFLPTAFEASVSYPMDVPPPSETDLSIVWRSDLDGVLGDTLLFSGNLTAGTHTITLEVTSVYGLSGTASATVSVSN